MSSASSPGATARHVHPSHVVASPQLLLFSSVWGPQSSQALKTKLWCDVVVSALPSSSTGPDYGQCLQSFEESQVKPSETWEKSSVTVILMFSFSNSGTLEILWFQCLEYLSKMLILTFPEASYSLLTWSLNGSTRKDGFSTLFSFSMHRSGAHLNTFQFSLLFPGSPWSRAVTRRSCSHSLQRSNAASVCVPVRLLLWARTRLPCPPALRKKHTE